MAVWRTDKYVRQIFSEGSNLLLDSTAIGVTAAWQMWWRKQKPKVTIAYSPGMVAG